MRSMLAGALAILLGLGSAGCTRGTPRGPCHADGGAEADALGTVCGFEDPEDIDYVESAGVIVASNMRFDRRDPRGHPRGGYLSALVPDTGEVRRLWPEEAAGDIAGKPSGPPTGDPICTAPPTGAFYPHGLTATVRNGEALVYVVAHQGEAGGREAVEILEVAGAGADARLRWRGCIPMSPGAMGNDVVVAPDGEVIVSNYQPSDSIWHTIRATVLGMNSGDVRGWLPGRGWRSVPHSDARLANGVATSRDGDTLFYSETGSGKVFRTRRNDGGAAISVDIGGNPDNLAWSNRGTLLVATHTGGAAMLACAFGRDPCRTSWEIHEIDPVTLATRRLLAHDGDVVGAVATPLVVGNRLYLGSVYDDRIGVTMLPAR